MGRVRGRGRRQPRHLPAERHGPEAVNLTADIPEDDEQPAFSPDGQQIAFRSGRDGGGIFVMGRTGEAVRRVTREGYSPAWSPDGTQLVYTVNRTELRPQNSEGPSPLMVVSAGGGELRQLHEGDTLLASWSPGGTRIVFSEHRSGIQGRANVVTIPATGGDAVAVTKDDFLNWNPVWAPDGGHLYFVSDRGGSMNIWRVAIDEDSRRPLGEPEPITTPASFAAHLSISADGRRLAYSAVMETQNIYKLTLDPATGEAVGDPVPVTTWSRFWSNPDPSPDGQWVVFHSQVEPEGDLYVIRTDGTGLRQLTDDPAIDRVPRWSPDGDWIAMFSDRSGEQHVRKIRVGGSELQQLTGAPSGVAAWSPDGRQLAVTQGITNTPEAGHAAIIEARSSAGEPGARALPPAPAPDPRFVPNSWSLDGQWIAGQNWYTVLGISIYSPAQRTYERLIDFGEWPVWLPDSRRILFVSRGRSFHVLDIRTKQTKEIFSVVRGTLGPARVARDRRAAYFSLRATESDVWVATFGS